MRQRGFTLLELIVVLAILGLATALVAPSMLRGIDSWQRQAAIDVLLNDLRALPGEARARGTEIVLDAEALQQPEPPLKVAGDWQLQVPEPWRVGSNGVCQGGEVIISNSYGSRTIEVAAPFCDPRVLP